MLFEIWSLGHKPFERRTNKEVTNSRVHVPACDDNMYIYMSIEVQFSSKLIIVIVKHVLSLLCLLIYSLMKDIFWENCVDKLIIHVAQLGGIGNLFQITQAHRKRVIVVGLCVCVCVCTPTQSLQIRDL